MPPKVVRSHVDALCRDCGWHWPPSRSHPSRWRGNDNLPFGRGGSRVWRGRLVDVGGDARPFNPNDAVHVDILDSRSRDRAGEAPWRGHQRPSPHPALGIGDLHIPFRDCACIRFACRERAALLPATFSFGASRCVAGYTNSLVQSRKTAARPAPQEIEAFPARCVVGMARYSFVSELRTV